MPYADLEQRRKYDREWRNRRRSEWIEENGPCPCGETEGLEIDHVDPKTKTVPIARIWSWSRERREEELAKCQVLCTSCHERKSYSEGWGTTPRHGTRSAMRRGAGVPSVERPAPQRREGIGPGSRNAWPKQRSNPSSIYVRGGHTMETRTLIKDTATVARVTALVEGDTYRRLIPKSTYESTKIAVGVVTGVLNNGEQVALTALEVKEGYGSEVEVKVFDADTDLALFPADHTEVLEILSAAQNYQRSAVERAEKALGDARDKEERLDKVVRLIDLAQQADRSVEA